MQQVGIVGLGLIGGSLGRALLSARSELTVVGITRDRAAATAAAERGLASRTSHDLRLVREADLVVIATPIPAIPGVLQQLSDILPLTTPVTDVGSVKGPVMEWAARMLREPSRFLGGHPMAGKAEGGMDAADGELFRGAAWVFTPRPGQDVARFSAWFDLVRAIGARPVFASAGDHDRQAALVSHLAFLLSSAYAATVASASQAEEAVLVAGPAFRDMVRLAGGDPFLHASLAEANRVPLLEALSRFEGTLAEYRRRLEAADGVLTDLFSDAKRAKDRWRI